MAADSYGFFWNSAGGDRMYDADSFSLWLEHFFTTGVFTGELEVTADGSSMDIAVATGYANISGKVGMFESAQSFTLDTADASYGRIDNVVVECNYSDRKIIVKVVTGTPASSPVAPTPTRDESAYQLVIAQIAVAAGAVTISQANITDTRTDSDLCGVVTGTVDEIDFDQIVAQFNSYFSQFKSSNAQSFLDWFEDMKDQLSEDAAGALQLEIDEEELRRQGFESGTTVFNADGSITYTDEDGSETTTVFNANGSITTTKVDSNNVQLATSTTVFNDDGSITVTASRT